VTGLAIVPSSAQIRTSTLGAQYQFTLAATFTDGSTGFLTGSATWTSSNRSVATVAAGLATSTGLRNYDHHRFGGRAVGDRQPDRGERR